jgi:hypothetical protein
MNNLLFAHMMANLCKPDFAELVLQVPTRYPGDGNYQHRLISAIAHGSQMAQICRSQETNEMIYKTAVNLLNGGQDNLDVQDEAARLIIGIVSHAHSMARITTEVADKIYAQVQPLAHAALPTGSKELEELKRRLDSAWKEISNIAHSAQMQRLLRNM